MIIPKRALKLLPVAAVLVFIILLRLYTNSETLSLLPAKSIPEMNENSNDRVLPDELHDAAEPVHEEEEEEAGDISMPHDTSPDSSPFPPPPPPPAIENAANDQHQHQHHDEKTDTVKHGSIVSNAGSKNRLRDFYSLLKESKPHCEPLLAYNHDQKAKSVFADKDVFLTKEYLSSILVLTDQTKAALQESHDHFVKGMENLNLDVFGEGTVYGKGIVIVAGDKFTWLSLLNIIQTRSVGCTLPIEIYIPSEKYYDEEFCEIISENLNAKCLLGWEKVPLEDFGFSVQRYEYKILAILSSSFEDILFLDADNVPLLNPSKLFDWDVYQDKGLVIWPDAWARTTNPFFYELTGIFVDEKYIEESESDYSYHELPGALPDPSSESGMILINKRKQLKTLLFASYLNLYGTDYFYPLITQGGPGEGDKDTFLAAAYAMKGPSYQVRSRMQFIGYWINGEFNSKSLAQCDPMTDNERDTAANGKTGVYSRTDCHLPLFFHMSFPKYLLDTISNEIKRNDKEIVLYEVLQDYGYIFELRFWETFTQLICTEWEKPSPELRREESSPIDSQLKLLGLKLNYIQRENTESYCNDHFLPHLKFLRKWFAYGDREKSQFEQDI